MSLSEDCFGGVFSGIVDLCAVDQCVEWRFACVVYS